MTNYPWSQPEPPNLGETMSELEQFTEPFSELKSRVRKNSIPKEELQLSNFPHTTNTRLASYRDIVNPSHIQLYQLLLDYFLPQGEILEVGSGGAAYVHDKLLNEELKSRWQMLEINHPSADLLKLRYPDIVTQGSAYRIKNIKFPKHFDHIFGNSSYDSMSHMRKALKAVYDKLESGGKFMHIQDVGPGLHTIAGLYYAYQENANTTLPFITYEKSNFAGANMPVFVNIAGEPIFVHQFMHNQMALIGESLGFNVLYNDTASTTVEHERDQQLHPASAFEIIWKFFEPVGAAYSQQSVDEVQRAGVFQPVINQEKVLLTSQVYAIVMEKP